MPSRDSTLRELARSLLSCAEEALLDAPLDALSSRVEDDLAREVLEAMDEAGEARSVRDLLEGGTLERWVETRCTAREEQALSLELGRLLGRGHVGDDDPARLARVPPPPNDLEGLLSWARPFGLLGELSRPAAEVLPGPILSGLDPDAAVVECCLGRARGAARGASLLSADRAREEARAYLAREAAAHASLSARAALWRQMSKEGPMRALAERLRALVAETDMASLHAVHFVPARRVSVDPETGAARAELHGGEREANVAVRLLLSGYEQRGLHGECSRCARPFCLHVRALAARLLDACCDDADRLNASLAEFVRVPSWKRFVRALVPDERAAPGESERIGFRLRIDGGRASVGVLSRKVQRSGRLSAGKLVAPQKLARSAPRTELDRAALELMTKANRPLSSLFVPGDLALLRSLVEHPFVSIEGGPDSVRVVEESLHVALVEAPGGLSLEVSLGGARLDRGAPPPGVAYVLRADELAKTVFFAALSPSLRRLLAALGDFRGVLPPESHPELARWLASIEKVARVSAPKSLRGMERPAPKRLLLRISPGLDQGVDVALLSRALPMSPLWPPGTGPELAHGLEDGAQVFARRDLANERALAERAVDALGLAEHLELEPFRYRLATTEAALEVLSRAARNADSLEIEWAERAPRLAITSVVRASDLAIRLFKKGEWCALEGSARSADADVAVGRLLDAARRGERFVRVHGDDFVEIERDLFERLTRAQLATTDGLRAPALASAAVPFFLEQLGDLAQAADAETREWLARASERASEPIATAPAHLREYQRSGAAFLIDRSRWAPGACLADEMGLGKTVQAIALLEARAALGPALVVAPTSVVDNWAVELARFAPELDARVLRGARRKERLDGVAPGTVLVTSYELLLRDVERFRGISFATQVVDEAQMVKNALTERAKAVRGVEAAFRVALSGTPVENRLADLWSLFQLIAPGLLGSWARFRGRFAVPIERYEDDERGRALRALVSPFILRRTKEEVAPELPSRTEVVHRVELSPAERELYDAAAREARRAFGKRSRVDSARTVQILAELTRLRQLACHPRLVIDDARLESSKLHALLALLDDVLPRGHRALLFSQFTSHLALVREALDGARVPYLYLDGATPAQRRASLVARFQAGEGAVFLISLKAGGTGLNLTAADYVVHLDPWWNPAAEDQASDRAHRLGQERPLTIVKLVSAGTIEESVLALHGHKRRLAEAVLAGSATPAKLDREALEALLACR